MQKNIQDTTSDGYIKCLLIEEVVKMSKGKVNKVRKDQEDIWNSLASDIRIKKPSSDIEKRRNRRSYKSEAKNALRAMGY